MKFQFEVKEHTLPEQWATTSSWPGKGVYRVPKEPDRLYCIGAWSVDVIYDTSNFNPLSDIEDSAVSESLLLKAIAAAAHGKVLK